VTRARRAIFAAMAMPVVAALLSLGVWQLHRLAWKRALIARVEQGLAMAPLDAPDAASWSRIGPDDSYRRVQARGVYQRGPATLVQAVSDLGPGYWALQPLDDRRGFTVLVNRGFVPADMLGRALPLPEGKTTVSGLLRLSEPHGGFLRANRPGRDEWHSRDVAAIAARRGIKHAAPYFIDADAQTSPGWPRGGLTVIRFPNNHLQYALTWFVMAALLAGAAGWVTLGPSRE
jgi:surfeit locus 1 family protein